MSEITNYNSFSDKEDFFTKPSKNPFSIISTIEDFEHFYNTINRNKRKKDIFRGLSEASYKLFNKAQRYWLQSKMENWNDYELTYIDVFARMISRAREDDLIKYVFERNDLNPSQRDFPVLSILQHYGAPTPLLDWTHNFNVALYFATLNVEPVTSPDLKDINQFISVYHIVDKEQNRDNSSGRNQFKHILDWNRNSYPTIEKFKREESNSNFLLYLSDQDRGKKILEYYNLHIVPQEGAFIFSPLPDRPIEECFADQNPDREFKLIPFRCYNIHKNLAEYIRRKLRIQKRIDHEFLFPNLKTRSRKITEEFLNALFLE